MGSDRSDRDHHVKMIAADIRLTRLDKRREQASKKITAAEKKYQTYGATR